LNCSEDFGPFHGKTWINCSHQGALPRVAAKAAQEAIAWKQAPHNLTAKRFTDVPARLRSALAKLLGAPTDEVALTNSASYGLHLLANGIPLREGDEVLLVHGDFPSVVLPWLGLEKRGITVRHLDSPLDPDELVRAMTPRSRVLCTTWVHSFTGVALNLDAVGAVCREHGVWFIVNGAQAVGARPIDVTSTPIDALVSVGFKWLCGPYGTGFCWMRPALRESLEVNQAYWLAMQTADDLGKEEALPTLRDDLGARAYDIFGTANFFNFMPWTASLEYLLAKGIDNIAAHDAALVDRLIEGLESRGYRVSSPKSGPERSTLILASHEDRSRNESIHRALREQNIEIAYRRGNLRFSPHLYNTTEDIDRALEALTKHRRNRSVS
jgi:selenocysteine lyase/cysteine desulfurase